MDMTTSSWTPDAAWILSSRAGRTGRLFVGQINARWRRSRNALLPASDQTAEHRPIIHQGNPPSKQVASTIGGFDLAAHDVSERHLRQFVCIFCPLGRPIAKCGSKAVGNRVHLHVAQHLGQGHVRQCRAVCSGKTMSSGLPGIPRTCSAALESAARCTLPPFMRSAGTVQVPRATSISPHVAPRISPERAAVRIPNIRARAPIPPTSERRAMNSAISSIGRARWCLTRDTFPGSASSLSRCPFHRAGFGQDRSSRVAAQSRTASNRPRTRLAVSVFVVQIGVRMSMT